MKMMILRSLHAGRNVRDTWYRVMAAQLRIGVPLADAVRTTAKTLPKNALATALGARVESVAGVGGRICSDWQKSGWLPDFDVALLTIAEREGSQALGEVFADLVEETHEKMDFLSAVVSKNVYPIGVFGIALAFLWFFKDFLEQIAGRYPQILNSQTAYHASIGLQEWGPFVLIFGSALCVVYQLLVTNVVGRYRKMLGPLGRGYELQMARRYLYFCSKMSARGASFIEMTDILSRIMKERYARSALKEMKARLTKGEDYMAVVGRTMLPPQLGNVLAGLAPAGERAVLADAYDTVAIIIQELLRGKYVKLAAAMKLVLLSINAVVVIMIVNGVYGTTTDLTDIVGRAR